MSKLQKIIMGNEKSQAAPFQKRAATPFFSLPKDEEPGTPDPVLGADLGTDSVDSPQSAGNERRPTRVAPRVSRADRLEGGIPSADLVRALPGVKPPETGPAKEILSEITRGVRFDLDRYEAIESFAGRRNHPSWARAALMFVAEQGVNPADLGAYAESVREGREAKGNRGRNVMVPLGETRGRILQDLARRSRLSEAQALEACCELYLRVHMAAAEKGKTATSTTLAG